MRNFPLGRRRCETNLAAIDLGKLIDEVFAAPFGFGLATIERAPAVDVFEKENKVIATVEIPGAKPEDIKLSVEGNLLTISGEKKEEQETKKENFHRIERAYGSFGRTVELPSDVKAEEAKATYKNGVLTVELPKAESARKKEIKIEIK